MLFIMLLVVELIMFFIRFWIIGGWCLVLRVMCEVVVVIWFLVLLSSELLLVLVMVLICM